jgi:exodeoxyribonuclease VII small subunit
VSSTGTDDVNENDNAEADATEVAAKADESLEARLARLEKIMGRLEADDVPLEEALELFEEGVGHVRAAEKILAQTELKVEELLADGTHAPVDEGTTA